MKNTEQIINIARRAMLLEAIAYPKPGLVDPLDNGSHQDMDIMTFIMSSISMDDGWAQMYQAGWQFAGTDLTKLFEQIRPLGLHAEANMLKATSGINTHKGAIFSLGIIIAAIGYGEGHHQLTSTDDIFELVKLMMANVLRDFDEVSTKSITNLTHGEKLYLDYNVLGIRKEAHDGFPIVQNYALPFLRQKGSISNDSLLDTLMLILLHCEDTNLIKRANDIAILDEAQQWANEYFALGGAQTTAGKTYLEQLNQTFIDNNLSIGGSADLLILTIFLYLYETEILKNKPC